MVTLTFALGRLDILINNAGSAPGGVIEKLSEDDWAQALQLKFMGYVRCLRYALPIMVGQGGGRVVNLIGNDSVKPSYWEIAPGAANAAGQNLIWPAHDFVERSIMIEQDSVGIDGWARSGLPRLCASSHRFILTSMQLYIALTTDVSLTPLAVAVYYLRR